MSDLKVGTVRENDKADVFGGTHADVSITNGGIELLVNSRGWGGYGGISLTPNKARELGFLLIKGADRHSELVKQIALIDEQRKTLADKQNSLIQELLK